VSDDDVKRSTASVRQHFLQKKNLLRALFSAAGLIDQDGEFLIGKQVSTETLGEFKKICRDREHHIQSLLNMELPSNFDGKSIAKLGQFLKAIGACWGKPVNTDVDGRRVKLYHVDLFEFDVARKYAERRIERRINANTTRQWDDDTAEMTLWSKKTGKRIQTKK
jgi:hypothetical protein